MNRTKKLLSVVLCAALLVGSLAGCSDKKDAKVLKVGMECGYAPFNWTQKDDSNGAVQISGSAEFANGYDVMMAKKIADQMGYTLEIVKTDWDGLPQGVISGKLDCAIAGISITSERKQSVDFTDVYYNASIIALTTKNSPYAKATSVAELKGAVCTSQLNTVWYNMLPQIPEAKIQPALENVPAMIVALTSGKIDLVCTDMPTATAAAFSNPDLVVLNFPDGSGFNASPEDIQMGIEVSKTNGELKEKLNKALATISEDDRAKLMEDAIKAQPLAQ